MTVDGLSFVQFSSGMRKVKLDKTGEGRRADQSSADERLFTVSY